jgi:uncharacterized protein (DUF2235 family)
MARRLIICIDGTWNSNAERSRFFSYPTNVARISQLLLDDGMTQRVIYIPGIGTKGLADRVVGGVWGAGITKLACAGYRFLCEQYQSGDEICLFGFSRGAFAVRSIGGLLINFGVLRRDRLESIREAMDLYRRTRNPRETSHAFRRSHCLEEKPPIAFVGVWDTVIRFGPLVAPLAIALESFLGRFGLVDHRIPHTVRYFCHALALDERRAAFWPWRAEKHDQSPPDQIEEMWFAGSHSDVGGGYLDSRLAEIPLRWMCERASAAGLVFDHLPSVGEDSALAPLHSSRGGLWQMLPSRRRIVDDSDRLHHSVERRMQCTSYRPAARLPEQMLMSLTRA